MKRILGTLLFLVIAGTIYLVLPCRNAVLAQSGCCKVRDSFSAQWRQNGLPFEACKRLNQQQDGDDVFARQGLVWWDGKCS